MNSPEKKAFMAIKEEMTEAHCEVVATLQGYAATYDSDGDSDEDEVKVATTTVTASIKAAITTLMASKTVARKTQGKKKLKVWCPRNRNYYCYTAKDDVSKKLKVSQLDGYGSRQVFVYITANDRYPNIALEETQP